MNQAVLDVNASPREVAEDPYSSLFRFSVSQFEQLIDLGILDEGAPYELLNGVIFHKNRADVGENEMTHGPRHALRVRQLILLLGRVAEQLGLELLCQLPLQLGPDNAPEPDFAFVKPLTTDGLDRHPQADEVVLVIEVASSSLNRDRNKKLAIYATAGIPEYWIINLISKELEVFRTPDKRQGLYDQILALHGGDQAELKGTAGKTVTLQVADLI